MAASIQHYVAKINSAITNADAVSLAVSSFCVLVLALFLVAQDNRAKVPVVYYENEGEELGAEDTRPFASVHGPTYTFSWCQGADKIKRENIVYFANAEEAERSGRTLSKLCER